MSHLGNMKKVTVDSKSTTLVGDGKTVKAIKDRAEQLRAQMDDVSLMLEERDLIRLRVAKLSSGVAVIKVGGMTELEIVEKKYRIEDALNATRAAVEEGIVSGGGMALYNAYRAIKGSKKQSAGAGIVLNACTAPLRKIVENAGHSPDVILSQLDSQAFDENSAIGFKTGFNAATGKYEDLVVEGVIDPVKVTRTALENAVSVTLTFLSLDAVVVEETREVK